jgi:hypothetical protein
MGIHVNTGRCALSNTPCEIRTLHATSQVAALLSVSFIEYKARLAGVRVQAVDPRNTSRLCPLCGCIDKANRKTQSEFLCVGCGYAANADINAARNIASRAAHVTPSFVLRHTCRNLCIRCVCKEARARFQAKAPCFSFGVAYGRSVATSVPVRSDISSTPPPLEFSMNQSLPFPPPSASRLLSLNTVWPGELAFR